MVRRAQLALNIFTELQESAERLCEVSVLFNMVSNDDERVNKHRWRVVFRRDDDMEGKPDVALDFFTEEAIKMMRTGEFNTDAMELINIIPEEQEREGNYEHDTLVVLFTLEYSRKEGAKEEEPLGEVKEKRRTLKPDGDGKKTMFYHLFKFAIETKLAGGDTCVICLGSACEMDDFSSYYVCPSPALHLMCYACRQEWRGKGKKTHCPQCTLTSSYPSVFTPVITPACGEDV